MPLMVLQEYAFHAYSISSVRPRIVFQYHPQTNSFKSILDKEIRKHPEVQSFRNEEAIYTSEKLRLAAEELNKTDYYICASSFTKQTLTENGADNEKVFVAPYGVSTSSFPYKVRDIPSIVSFIFVGSFVERKGLYYLLKAAKRLEDEGFDFKLNMTGRLGGNQNFERFKIKNCSLYNNLRHEELVSLLHNSNVFVFPSLFEGFAFVIVEAMATGLPVITTPRTIGPDVITDNEEGFIIEPSNEDAIYEKMKYFIMHPEKCVEMGKKAHKCSSVLTWDNFDKSIMNAVEIIEKKSI